jgi:hypothetical protein
VSLQFTISNDKYTLTDAIVGSPDYINNLTSEQILTIQQERFNSYVDLLSSAE